MALQQIQIHTTVRAPVDKVFAVFADHEKFATLLGARARRVKEGEDDRTAWVPGASDRQRPAVPFAMKRSSPSSATS